MAVNNINNYVTTTDGMAMPLSMTRGNPNPLDDSTVWKSYEDAHEYSSNSPIAYVGELLSVIDEENSLVKVYVIKNENGDLLEVGSKSNSENYFSVEKTGRVATIRAVKSDGTTDTVYITDGINGTDGVDGITPIITINEDGEWCVNGTSTGTSALGIKGDQGEGFKISEIFDSVDDMVVCTTAEDGQLYTVIDGGRLFLRKADYIDASNSYLNGWVEVGDFSSITTIKGDKGDTGEAGHSPAISINSTTGTWVIDGQDTNYVAKGAKGDTGEKGDVGSQGTHGINVFVAFAKEITTVSNSTGTAYTISNISGFNNSVVSNVSENYFDEYKYIGIYSGSTSTAPTDPYTYSWFQFRGKEVSVKYRTNSNNHTEIGICVDYGKSNKTDADYSWYELGGTSTFVKYAKDENGLDMQNTPSSDYNYIGIYVGNSESQNASDYNWFKVQGVDGYSPSISISSKINNKRTITFTTKDHPNGESFDIFDGENAYDDTEIQTKANNALSAINVINGNVSTVGSVDYKIAQALNGFTSIEFDVVTTLPSTGLSGHIYLLPSSDPKTKNIYDEYVYLTSDNRWEKIGSTEIDLSGYYNKTEVDAKLSDYVKNTIINNYSLKTDVPTLVKVDGTTITKDADGTIHGATEKGVSQYTGNILQEKSDGLYVPSIPLGTNTVKGIIKTDNNTIVANSDNAISVKLSTDTNNVLDTTSGLYLGKGTNTSFGAVKVDNETIQSNSGIISTKISTKSIVNGNVAYDLTDGESYSYTNTNSLPLSFEVAGSGTGTVNNNGTSTVFSGTKISDTLAAGKTVTISCTTGAMIFKILTNSCKNILTKESDGLMVNIYDNLATTSEPGFVIPDNDTITIDSNGKIIATIGDNSISHKSGNQIQLITSTNSTDTSEWGIYIDALNEESIYKTIDDLDMATPSLEEYDEEELDSLLESLEFEEKPEYTTDDLDDILDQIDLNGIIFGAKEMTSTELTTIWNNVFGG